MRSGEACKAGETKTQRVRPSSNSGVSRVREQLNGSREVRRDDAGEEREEREEREEAGEERGAGEERDELEDAAWASDAICDRRRPEDRAREEAEEVESGDEEGRQAKGLTAPKTVSKEERDEHERTHIPFRCWCKACVRGRKRKLAHKKRSDEEKMDERKNAVPRISMDYHFMSKADEDDKKNPLLTMVNEKTGDKYTRAVGQKGVGTEGEVDWLIRDMSDELKSWGHAGGAGGKLILKCDGEASIKALRNAVAKFHGGEVIPEEAAKGESQSNGTVEEAGKTVREYVRVYKEHIEDKTGIKLMSQDVIVMWMIRWAAMALSRFQVGSDGNTAYERRKQRRCKLEVVPIGERVWYKQIRAGK